MRTVEFRNLKAGQAFSLSNKLHVKQTEFVALEICTRFEKQLHPRTIVHEVEPVECGYLLEK